ncbi:MAG: hypothetical protein R2710_05675 [Acidimicrobiales bacterium]
MLEAKAAADNPAIVRELGAHGWVARTTHPNTVAEVCLGPTPRRRSRRSQIERRTFPRLRAAAAATIQQWSSDETKRRLLPSTACVGDERSC